MSTKRVLTIKSLIGLLAIAFLATVGLVIGSSSRALRSVPEASAYVGSTGCASCHEDRHASWQRTYHRTMTQQANQTSVLGQFSGAPLSAFGGLVQPGSAQGKFWFDYLDASNGQTLGRSEVLRTVGSHRYQQYLSKAPDSETYYRLHYLWHVEDKRWVHMNAAFLGSDNQAFDAQVTVWNSNCVFCHNTGPEPRISNLAELRARAQSGEPVRILDEMRFDTQVAELGIGCESCHGPAGEHSARMGNWSTRIAAKMGIAADASIVNPEHLSASLSNDSCGACHAARTPKSVAGLDQLLSAGPSFRPGDKIADHVEVLNAQTPSPDPHNAQLFSNRFWADGAVRLSAYEYQALNASACVKEDKLACITCHSMHGGDPAGMLTERNRGDAPCLGCHQDLRNKLAQHTKHQPDSAGARCVACHMPKQVYGVMTIHRTHQIQVPDPAADLAAGKPNACLNCHAERSGVWAAKQIAELWPGQPVPTAIQRGDGASPDIADGLAALLAGDPVRQAISAYELGQLEQATSVDALRVRIPWLIEALEDDRPAIRRFAHKALLALDAKLSATGPSLNLTPILARFDFTGAIEERKASVAELRKTFALVDKTGWAAPDAATGLSADYQLDPALLSALLALGASAEKQIDIGE